MNEEKCEEAESCDDVETDHFSVGDVFEKCEKEK